MSEQLTERIERLDLTELQNGDTLLITTGVGDEAYKYEFLVEKADRWPVGVLHQTNPQGDVDAVGPFMLQGCGIWTDRRQNPCQTQPIAFTSYFCDVSLGSFMVGSPPESPANRWIFDKRGQEISDITVRKAGAS